MTTQQASEAATENGQAVDPLVYDQEGAGTGHLEDRLARVTAHVSRIPKRGYNKEQKYRFVAHSDVLDTIRPALAAEGVQFRSRVTRTENPAEEKIDGTPRTTTSGMIWRMWRVEVEFAFRCRVDHELEEQVVEDWPGYAQDYSDKGASKALTSAIKTFLIQQFLVSTGDDPDEATEQPQEERSRTETRSTNPAETDIRVARRAALDFGDKLPTGKLGQIAKKLCGNGMIMKIDDLAMLQKIARAAAKYVENPEAAEAWLSGEQAAPDGAQEPERQEAAGEPEEPAQSADDPAGDTTSSSEDDAPYPEHAMGADAPVSENLPALDSYDPPLTPEELRQHGLGLDPRPSYAPKADDDDTPF